MMISWRKSRDGEEFDRLSDLPDGILHQILSFLDTKSSVRSSAFSRRWRCVWKCVPVLTFSRLLVGGPELDFVQHVDQVLSLRSDCAVRKITTEFAIRNRVDLFDRVMRYAACHGGEQLSVNAYWMMFSDAMGSVCASYQSLKVLELQSARLDKTAIGLWSRLQLLETLTLVSCIFDGFGREGVPHDAFAHFPMLKSLKMIACSSRNYRLTSALKVFGPNLLNLEIRGVAFAIIEIVTPKLQSVCFTNDSTYHMLPEVSMLDVPSLNRANIDLLGNKHMFLDTSGDIDSKKQLLLKRCLNLFNVLYNVQYLNLQLETFELLVQIYNLVKHQPSPFNQMKSLHLKYTEGSLMELSQVIGYLLKNSPNDDDKQFTVEKVKSQGSLKRRRRRK